MKHRYLEVTFRKGKPLAAYLYLPRPAGAKARARPMPDMGCGSTSTRRVRPSEWRITAPGAVSIAQLNAVLSPIGVARPRTRGVGPVGSLEAAVSDEGRGSRMTPSGPARAHSRDPHGRPWPTRARVAPPSLRSPVPPRAPSPPTPSRSRQPPRRRMLDPVPADGRERVRLRRPPLRDHVRVRERPRPRLDPPVARAERVRALGDADRQPRALAAQVIDHPAAPAELVGDPERVLVSWLGPHQLSSFTGCGPGMMPAMSGSTPGSPAARGAPFSSRRSLRFASFSRCPSWRARSFLTLLEGGVRCHAGLL